MARISLKASLLLFGFVILLAGIFVAWSSVGMLDQGSFGSASTLPDASIRLVVGVFVAFLGMALLFVGLFSSMRKHAYAYY